MSAYDCSLCQYSTLIKSNFSKHLKTAKHQSKIPAKEKYECVLCGKKYSGKNGLWYHKRKCFPVVDEKEEEQVPAASNEDIIELLHKQEETMKQQGIMLQKNEEVMQNLLSIASSPVQVQQTINNTQNNNFHFNLQFFLNDTCKDALNISDFINSVTCTLEDAIRVGNDGYVKGITDTIINQLKKLSQDQRPLHCTDLKRQVMYIKENDVWEKDVEQVKLRKAVTDITKINSRVVPQYKELHPDCYDSESNHSDIYNVLIVEAMGGQTLDMKTNQVQIMKNIAKHVTIDKTIL